MKPFFCTPENENHFFGYYDKSPLNKDSKLLLTQKIAFNNRMPIEYEKLEIGLFSISDNNNFNKIATTSAWNWQQGSMLQWLGPEYEKVIIFNDIYRNHFVTRKIDISNSKEEMFDFPIYTISNDGNFGLSVDYERLYWLRKGYCYEGIINPQKKNKLDPNDGIWKIDLITSEIKQIINIQQLLEVKPIETMFDDAAHYIEHLMINPSNNRFMFLHRWKMKSGDIYTRLFTADVNGTDIVLLNDSGRMSHCCWMNNNEIIGYGGLSYYLDFLKKNKIDNKLFYGQVKNIYHFFSKRFPGIKKAVLNDSYIRFIDKTKVSEKILPGILEYDGHPSFHPSNEDYFITDTYPDLKGQSLLLFVNLINKRIVEIDLLSQPVTFNDTGYRCDLHPKWSIDGKFIAIDTFNNKNKRAVYLYNFEKFLNENTHSYSRVR